MNPETARSLAWWFVALAVALCGIVAVRAVVGCAARQEAIVVRHVVDLVRDLAADTCRDSDGLDGCLDGMRAARAARRDAGAE